MRNLGIIWAFSFSAVLYSTLPCAAEGALATGSDQRGGHWAGITYNSSSVQAARDNAMRECLNRGPNCSVACTFRNACIAFAFGRLPDARSGYEWVTRKTLAEAQIAVMTNCRNRGGYCELKGSSCDTVDEAQIARERGRAEERAAAEAARRRAEAKEAATRAQQEAEARAGAARLDAVKPPKYTTTPSSFIITPATALGFGALALLAVLVIAVKRDLPNGARVFISFGAPIMAGVIHYVMGIKDEIPLYELTLLSLPFGGALVAALAYKVHA